MKKKKVAVVMSGCYPGGVTKALLDFLYYISKDTLDISLLVKDLNTIEGLPIPKSIIVKRWTNKMRLSILVKQFDFPGIIKLIWIRIMCLVFYKNKGRKSIYTARLYDVFPEKYDVVIGYHMNVNLVAVITLDKIESDRKILWIHGKKEYEKRNVCFFEKLYSKADAIVAVSKDTEDRFVGLFPELAGKTTIIHNFYDFDLILQKASEPIEPLKSNDEVVIVSTGRLSKEKGFDRVPKVTKRLVDDGYNIKWYIAGDGDKRESISASVKEKGLEKNVILTGYVDNPFPYVKSCDIYVQPSYTEGFCTSTMEAKILKRPVVTTDVPGMNEQFTSGYDGLIVESSVDGLYNGIKRLIDDKELYDSIIQHLNEETLSNDEEVQKALKAITG